MRRLLPLALWLLAETARALPQTPAELYGDLFRRVQMAEVFPDGKDFVDCVPKRPPAEIRADYERLKDAPDFDLAAFVHENFALPRNETSVRTHIEALWTLLERRAEHPPKNGSLLALPRPYVVPGGRFEELYYWDSYFVMLGLAESGRVAMVGNMVDDFASLIARHGFIPNASRTYYLTRSQPPFFSLMVDLLASKRGDGVYRKYRGALAAEHAFWMDEAKGHVVHVEGHVLNHYYDQGFTPREEQYRTDALLSKGTKRDPARLFHEIRSAAESGWDFSSRWFADGKSRATVRTTEIAPVDLNCLLYHLERTLAKADHLAGDKAAAQRMDTLAARRKDAINALFWSADAGWYVDYDLSVDRRAPERTLAGMMPFFTGVAPKDRAPAAARTLAEKFLQPGGVVTTLRRTGEQWDAPNGWAPLQWITIEGLREYGQDALAARIAKRWIALNTRVYRETGKLMEKYDVMDVTKPGGGGEYPTQDGFGWTNGVLLKLMNLYGEPAPRN
jgi:alpha,alpha-trehalase